MKPPPIYCCIPIEFIQPWDQNEAIRQVKDLGLGNMVMLQGTFHVGNSEADRQQWKSLYPSLAAKVDALPRFPERPQHGMTALFDLPLEVRLGQVQLCRDLGLKILTFFPALLHLPEEEYARVLAAGRDVGLMEMILCENTSLLGGTVPVERLRQIDATPVGSHAAGYTGAPSAGAGPSVFDHPATLDFRAVHDWFVTRFREVGERLRGRGVARLGAVEATCQLRLAMEAGVDVPVLELVPHEPLRGLASVRGAARAYGKPLWGVHTAMGYYRAPTDAWTPERLRIANHLFFAGGASIFSECNLPLRNWGSCSAFFTIRASPPIRDGEVECREFDDPICACAREIVGEHYRFTQFHQRPAASPRVPFGFILGYLDGWTGSNEDRMWMVDQPGFLAPEALQTWRHFERAFDSEPWYIAPRKYYWQADPSQPLRLGTPPAGQVDLVPAEAPTAVLNSYGCLAFLGWNTMTDDLYARLRAYVEQGGTLFLSVPHLDTRTRTDRPRAFIRGGDVQDLCGVKIVGPGPAIEEALFTEQTADPRYRFPRGTLFLEEAPLAQLELHGARPLAWPREKPDQPLFLEHRLGQGVVYLLATWEYPGARLDAFITDVLRTLADGQQGDIAVESRDVFYAVYDGKMPAGAPFATVYLVNHDIYGQPAWPVLRVRDARIPVRVGRELRLAWVFDDLVVAPHDRFVNITDARRDPSGWTLTLQAAPATPGAAPDAARLIQLAPVRGTITAITLDGQPLPLINGPEGDAAVRCRFPSSAPATLRVTMN